MSESTHVIGMSDLTAQVRNTTRAVEEVVKQVNQSINEIQRQSQLLEGGFRQLDQALESQVRTLGELEIIRSVSELTALRERIALEEEAILGEQEEDTEQLQRLEESIAGLLAEVESKRNRQVARLFEDNIYELWDHDLRRATESAEGVLPLIDDFVRITEGQIETRRAGLREAVEAAAARVEELRALRRRLRTSIQDALSEAPDFLVQEPTAVAVPFYVVEIEDSGGHVRTELLPPSRRFDDSTETFSYDLRPLRGFRSLQDALAEKIGKATPRVTSATGSTARTVEDLVDPGSADSWSGRWARKLMVAKLRGRPYEERRWRGGEHGLRHVEESEVLPPRKRRTGAAGPDTADGGTAAGPLEKEADPRG